jgi:hypothetical protein
MTIFRSELKELNKEWTRASKPLNTESTTISAMVPTATPNTVIAEIRLMVFCDFFANRYLLAMKKGKFNL